MQGRSLGPEIAASVVTMIIGALIGLIWGVIIKGASPLNSVIFGAIVGGLAGLINGFGKEFVTETPGTTGLFVLIGGIVGSLLGWIVVRYIVPDEQLAMASGKVLSRIVFWMICGGGIGGASGMSLFLVR